VPRSPKGPPEGAVVSIHRHRVAFFETDAMGIVHHANYVRHLELARIHWLDEHDQPYRVYAEQGLHYATIHMEIDYYRSTGFDDTIEIVTWLDWVRGASMHIEYELLCDGDCVATASTTHAMVNREGQVRRIPRDRLANLKRLALRPGPKVL
jgi:acyl-CoA thioester hydrolase